MYKKKTKLKIKKIRKRDGFLNGCNVSVIVRDFVKSFFRFYR